MTYKELNAGVMIVSGAGVAAWVAWEAMTAAAPDVVSVAWRLLYAIGLTILINIVLMILATILVSIARRRELMDERADERDRAINDRSMRNSYFALSIGGLGVIVALALGQSSIFAAYALFAVLLIGGLIDPVSRLVYYRIS
jgi:heme/copper-type cytochrome/quinol oxidase subunit 2